MLGNKLGEGNRLIHPNDDVNKSQSSNDTFPTAMHIAAYRKIVEYTIPTIEALKNTLPHLSELAIGGTAVGTGLNSPEGYDRHVSATIARLTNLPFVSAENKFESLAANDAIVETHGAIKQSAALMADASQSFNDHCAIGIEPNLIRIEENLHKPLMLVTALNPHIGYENAARIAKKAYRDNSGLKEAALALGLVTEKQFDEWVVPRNMIGPLK